MARSPIPETCPPGEGIHFPLMSKPSPPKSLSFSHVSEFPSSLNKCKEQCNRNFAEIRRFDNNVVHGCRLLCYLPPERMPNNYDITLDLVVVVSFGVSIKHVNT